MLFADFVERIIFLVIRYKNIWYTADEMHYILIEQGVLKFSSSIISLAYPFREKLSLRVHNINTRLCLSYVNAISAFTTLKGCMPQHLFTTEQSNIHTCIPT